MSGAHLQAKAHGGLEELLFRAVLAGGVVSRVRLPPSPGWLGTREWQCGDNGEEGEGWVSKL